MIDTEVFEPWAELAARAEPAQPVAQDLEPAGADVAGASLTADGYGANLSFVAPFITVTATNFLSRGALGAKHRAFDVRELKAAAWTDPARAKNGSVDLLTEHGKTSVQFVKKQTGQMRAVFDAITAAAPPKATTAVARDAVHGAALAKDKTTIDELKAAHAEEREERREFIEWASSFDGATAEEVRDSGFILQPDERLFATIAGAVLVEPRRTQGRYVGASSGVSFRIAKGVSYRVGQQRGRFVPGPDAPTVIDEGDAAITTRRVLFRGPKQSREWLFAKLTGVDHEPGGSWTALSVANRQRTSGIGYGAAAADDVRLRLAFALSVYRGEKAAFLASVQGELDHSD